MLRDRARGGESPPEATWCAEPSWRPRSWRRPRRSRRARGVRSGGNPRASPRTDVRSGPRRPDPRGRRGRRWYRRADEAAVLNLEDGAEAVGVDLIGAEEPEVSMLGVPGEGVAQKLAQLAGRLVTLCGGLLDFQRVVAEVGQVEVFEDPAAVGVWASAHAMVALRGVGGKLGDQATLLVEQLFGVVGAHPLLQHREPLRVGPDVRQRNLVGAEGTLDGQAAQLVGTGPPLGRAQHDSGPARASEDVVLAPLALDSPDAFVAGVQRRCERLVHRRRSVPLDEVDLVAVPFEHGADLVVGGTTQHGGVGNLVAVEVQNRQDRSVARRVEEADGLPG